MYIYYHNPKCRTSREGLDLLSQKGITLKIKDYLKEGLTPNEVANLSKLLGLPPLDFIRKKEEIYRIAERPKTFEEWCQFIAENPSLLERPILSTGKKAVIGRPPGNLLTLIA